MKKLTRLLLMSILAIGLAGCATTGTGENQRVKCPACGYEFNVQDPSK